MFVRLTFAASILALAAACALRIPAAPVPAPQ